MKKMLIGLCIGLVLGGITGSVIVAVAEQNKPQAAPMEPTTAQLLSLVNAERAKHGVAPLKEDARLDASAQMKANDEVAYNYFGHVSPHDGKQGYLYINDVDINCTTDSENLTENLPNVNTAQQAVYSWIQSPPHHAAMIEAKYTLTGFGIAGNEIVEHFCQQ